MSFKKNTLYAACALIIIAAVSCTKDPVAGDNGYLKFSNSFVHVANTQHSSGRVTIESNIDWKLSLEEPAPDWVSIDKSAGHGNDALVVTATTTNPTRDYRFAKIIATPVNNSTILPVQLLVVQYDSTASANH